MEPLTSIISCGAGATALVDLWALVRRRLFRTPLPNYALVGRWVGHFRVGTFRHAAIVAAPRLRGEHASDLQQHGHTRCTIIGAQHWLGMLARIGIAISPGT